MGLFRYLQETVWWVWLSLQRLQYIRVVFRLWFLFDSTFSIINTKLRLGKEAAIGRQASNLCFLQSLPTAATHRAFLYSSTSWFVNWSYDAADRAVSLFLLMYFQILTRWAVLSHNYHLFHGVLPAIIHSFQCGQIHIGKTWRQETSIWIMSKKESHTNREQIVLSPIGTF